MSINDSNYRSLLNFAFIPRKVLEHSNLFLRGDDLLYYLLFSFEKNKGGDKIVVKDEYAYFNIGIRDSSGASIYAYFEINRNNRQKWCLKQLATAETLKISDEIQESECSYQEYNLDLYTFSYAHDDKFKPIANFFDDNIHETKKYINATFKRAYQLGYIHYENHQAVFNTGLENESYEPLYAIFSKNINGTPEWFLNGFISRPSGFSSLPNKMPNSGELQSRQVKIEIKRVSENIENCTLLVTAIALEYDALIDVLDDNNLHYTEGITTDVGGRELKYIFIEKLNTVAILSGQSFECIIPLIQGILEFKPQQAILSGIAFSFDMKMAPFNSIVVSKNVWDYESAKINEENTKYRGNKLPSALALRQLFTQKLERGMVIKSGNYASGMKVVNSIEYQTKIKEFEPELLAGDQEGYFFAHSCNEFKINWIIIKAISDYGFGKSDEIQKVAAYAALKFVIKGLREQNR